MITLPTRSPIHSHARARHRISAACSFCIVLTLSSGVAPAAASTMLPVRIEECHMDVPRGAPSPYTQAAITFTNQRAVAATEVRFIVVYDGRTAHITDRGMFSQNVAIIHAFHAFDAPIYYGLLPKICDVEYIRYSDGTTWTAPSASNP